jgi:hypothetical protein
MRAFTASIIMCAICLSAVAFTVSEASAQRGGSGGRGASAHGGSSITGHRAFVGERAGYGARRQRGQRIWAPADIGGFAGAASGPVGYDDVYEYRYTYTNYPYTYGNGLYNYSYAPVPYGYQVGYSYPDTFMPVPPPDACAFAARRALPCR